MVYKIIKIVLLTLWILATLKAIILISRNELNERKHTRVMANKRATDRTTKVWNELFVSTCEDYEDKLKEKDEQIERLNEQLASVEKELERWEYIARNIRLTGVKKNENKA